MVQLNLRNKLYDEAIRQKKGNVNDWMNGMVEDELFGSKRTIKAVFTDDEWEQLIRIKNPLKAVSWHDLLLQAFTLAEPEIKKRLLAEGATESEIEKIFSGKETQE